MKKKIKYAIGIVITILVVLTIVFVLASLDKLDYQYYGLNYNLITANFSQKAVYQSGLHLIGFSNVLLEIPKIFQQISLPKIQTYTQDYFRLTLSAEVSYQIIVPNNTQNGTQKFDYLESFYILFGSIDEQNKILKPIIRNQIIKVASSYSSSDYRIQDSLAKTLETRIKSSLEELITLWTNIQFSILLSSIVCEGISFNIEPYQRQISSLIAQSQRIQSQKIQMTNYIQSVLQKTSLQMSIIQSIIVNSIQSTQMLNKVTNLNASGILLSADQILKNFSFASSELSLRPQLYLLKPII